MTDWREREYRAFEEIAEKAARMSTQMPDAETKPQSIREYYGLTTPCHAGRDGDCVWKDCPQLRDNEPKASGRHCPLDVVSEDA